MSGYARFSRKAGFASAEYRTAVLGSQMADIAGALGGTRVPCSSGDARGEDAGPVARLLSLAKMAERV
jgi:hypothetical protein